MRQLGMILVVAAGMLTGPGQAWAAIVIEAELTQAWFDDGQHTGNPIEPFAAVGDMATLTIPDFDFLSQLQLGSINYEFPISVAINSMQWQVMGMPLFLPTIATPAHRGFYLWTAPVVDGGFSWFSYMTLEVQWSTTGKVTSIQENVTRHTPEPASGTIMLGLIAALAVAGRLRRYAGRCSDGVLEPDLQD